MLEPSRTNLFTYSEELDNAAWAKRSSGGGSVPIVTADVATSPDGTTNADRVVFDAAGGTSLDQSFIRQSVSVTSGVNYIISFYLKSNTASSQQILFVRDSAISAAITVTTSWTRFNLSFTATSTATTNWGLFLNGNTSASADLLVYGAQLEIGSYATSYIPTSGSAVTRVADICNNGANEQVINSTEGVLYAEISALANGGVGDRYISLGSGSSQNTIQLLFHNTANRVNFRLTKAGSLEVNISDFTFLQTDDLKIACKFKENDFALWINGVKRAVDTSGETFSVNTLQEIQFDSGTGASNFYGKCKDLRVYNEALTDAELQALTSN